MCPARIKDRLTVNSLYGSDREVFLYLMPYDAVLVLLAVCKAFRISEVCRLLCDR